MESKLQKSINDYLKGIGAFTLLVNGSQYKGIPDIIAIYKGRVLGIEVKQPGCKATKIQKAVLEQMKSAGAITLVEDDIEYSSVRYLIWEIDNEII